MKEIFDKATQARSTRELDMLIEGQPAISAQITEFEEKYPDFQLTIQRDEIDGLIADGIITSDHTINTEAVHKFSPLEKLLLSVLWKNGHAKRVQPILDGIIGERKSQSDFGVIFRQFGRSLVNAEEPIVDQHVLRAFCTFGDTSVVKGRRLVPRKAAFKESDQDLIDAYREWFKSILKEIPLQQRQKFKYRFDKVLFVVGKNIE